MTKYNIKIIMLLHIITIPTFTTNIQINHFKITLHVLKTLPKYKYIHFKTRFMYPRSIAGVRSSQALPGSFLMFCRHTASAPST